MTRNTCVCCGANIIGAEYANCRTGQLELCEKCWNRCATAFISEMAKIATEMPRCTAYECDKDAVYWVTNDFSAAWPFCDQRTKEGGTIIASVRMG